MSILDWFDSRKNGRAHPPAPGNTSSSGGARQEDNRFENTRPQQMLAELVPFTQRDWYSIGEEIARRGGTLDSARLVASSLVAHHAQIAVQRLEGLTARSGLDGRGLEEQDQQELERITTQMTSISEMLRELDGASETADEEKVTAKLGESRQQLLAYIAQLNTAAREATVSRLSESEGAIKKLVEVDKAFGDVALALQRKLFTEEQEDKRELLLKRIRQLQEEWETTLTSRLEILNRLDEASSRHEETRARIVENAKQFAARQSRLDLHSLRAFGANAVFQQLARRKGYLYLLGTAVFVGAVAEFSVVSHFTAGALGLGSFSDSMNEIVAGVDRTKNLVELLTVAFLSLLPFALGFVVKGLIETPTEVERDRRYWINWITVVCCVGYFGTTAWLTYAMDEAGGVWETALALFFFSILAILLNGWLLHHFFRSYAYYRETRAAKKARRKELQASLRELAQEAGVRRAALQVSARQAQREEEQLARERAELQVAAQAGGSGAADSHASAAVLAAVEAGYAAGLIQCVGGAYRPETAGRQSLDDLSEIWRKLQVMRSLRRD